MQHAARSWDDYRKTMSTAVDIPDFRGFTPLMLAAYRGDSGRLRELVAKGANPNFPDAMGNTPLMGVAFKGNVEIAKILLRSGADLHLKNKAGLDAFDIASSFGRIGLVRLFSDMGVEKRKVAKLRTIFQLLKQGLLTATSGMVSVLHRCAQICKLNKKGRYL